MRPHSGHGPASLAVTRSIAIAQMLADAVRDELAAGLASARLPLLMSVPAVQAATLRHYFLAERQLAEALHRAYPDTLDLEAAAAAIGCPYRHRVYRGRREVVRTGWQFRLAATAARRSWRTVRFRQLKPTSVWNLAADGIAPGCGSAGNRWLSELSDHCRGGCFLLL